MFADIGSCLDAAVALPTVPVCCFLAGRESVLDGLHVDEGHAMTSLAVGGVPPALLERGLVP